MLEIPIKCDINIIFSCFYTNFVLETTIQISQPASDTPDISKYETNLSQSTVILGGYEHDPVSDKWNEVAPYPIAPVSPKNSIQTPKHFQNFQNKISQSKQLLSNIFKTEKMQKTSDNKENCFTQSMKKSNSPYKDDISRRMSEPLNLRITNSPTTIHSKDFIVVSKSSLAKHGSFNGIIDEKAKCDDPTKIHESFQVYSLNPTPRININTFQKQTIPNFLDQDTNISSISNTEIPPLESICVPSENVSTETQIDTSVNSCVFVSDQSNTLDLSLISEPEQKNTFRPLLLLIPLRLGQDKFNLEYAKPLLSCLKLPQSVGIIGGRPKHALYLIGFQDDRIFYLDPHTTQQAVNTPHGSLPIPDKTFHTTYVESMHFSELDPSLAVGFFCETEAVFEDLLDKLENQVLCLKPKLFEISESIPFLFQQSKYLATSAKQEPFSLVEKGDILVDLALDEDIDDWDIVNFDQLV